MHARILLSWSAALLCALPLSTYTAEAQQPTPEPHTLGSISGAVPLTNGLRIETTSGGVEQIIALRNDVLRVRAAAGHSLPEDASWAVLPEIRSSSVAVTREDSR